MVAGVASRPPPSAAGPKCQQADTHDVGRATVATRRRWACLTGSAVELPRNRRVPMRLRHRAALGLALAALGALVPANRWFLLYAGVVLVVLVSPGPLLVEPVVERQAAVDGDVLAGDIARPGVAQQEQGDPGDVGGDAGLAGGGPRPQAAGLGHLLGGGSVLGGPGPA